MSGNFLLGDNGNFRLGKFRSAGKAALGNKDRSRGNLSVPGKGGVDVIVYKVGGKGVGGALRAAKHHHRVFARHIILYVVKQAFKLAAPGRKSKRAEIGDGAHGNFAHRAHKGIYEHGVRAVEHGIQLRLVNAESVAPGKENSLLKKYGNILVLLRGKAFEHAFERYIFRNADHGVWHIVEKRCGEFIDEGNISVRCGKPQTGVQPLQILLNMRLCGDAVFSP